MADDTTTLIEDDQTVVTADQPEAEATEDETKDAAPAEEVENTDAPAEGDDEEAADDEEPDAWEFSFGGSTLTVDKAQLPEDVAAQVQEHLAGFNKHNTQTAQANAEMKKSLEAQREAMEQISTMQAEVMDEYARGMQARAELEQLAAVDMNALWQSDRDQARRMSDRMSQLQAQWQTAIQAVDQKETAFRQAREQEMSRVETQGRELMDRRIKDFSTKIAPKVVDYVVDKFDMDRDEAEKWGLNPATAEMAYKAMLYDEAQAKLKTPAKSEPPKPLTKPKGGSRATAAPDPSKMSTDDWMKWRRKDLQKRGVRIG